MDTHAIAGFVTLGTFLVLVLFTRLPVLLSLILVPILGVLALGGAGDIGKFALDGLRSVAPVATMILFAILYFGLMLDSGMFEPMVRRLLRLVRDDPVRLCLVSALLPMLVALDGDGATTFLISVTALLPVHRRLGVNPLILPAIVALAAGVMNMLPWGGPTARAMAAIHSSVDEIFLPIVPAMIGGAAWVLLAAFIMGLRERRRLGNCGNIAGAPDLKDMELPALTAKGRISRLFLFNAVLTGLLVLFLFQGLYAKRFAIPKYLRHCCSWPRSRSHCP